MKTILFRLYQFPHLSETFILAQITTAINLGLDVKILVTEVLNFPQSTHEETLEKFKIREKLIIEDFGIPRNKFIRLLQAFQICLRNFSERESIYKYLRSKRKFSLTWIFEYFFFKQFEKFDLIHIQYGTNIYPFDILKKIGLYKGKLIVSFHGHDAFFPINGFISNNGYYRNLFGGESIVVANTPYLGKKLLELGCRQDQLKIIPVGVDTDFFYKKEEKERAEEFVTFISVGRLDQIKGHRYAIELIHKLKKSGKKVRLTIIGEGVERVSLANLIIELDLRTEVSLEGSKSQEEIRNFLWNNDIYILPAVPLKDGRRETQGLATLEAEACGLPVLAFDSGGIKYTVVHGETGFLCGELNMECLFNRALMLLKPEIRQKMGKNASKYVRENFSQTYLEREWKKIYFDEFK